MSSLFGDLVGQALGQALGGAQQQAPQAGGLGGMLGSMLGGGQNQQSGGLGGMLGSLLGGGQAPSGNSAMLMTLLPIAMQYVQANGGIGAVLAKFQGAGHADAAASWVGTGANQAIGADAVSNVLGADTIAQMAQSSGLPAEHVSGGLAEILPELVNKLSPTGAIAGNSGDMLSMGLSALQAFTAKS